MWTTMISFSVIKLGVHESMEEIMSILWTVTLISYQVSSDVKHRKVDFYENRHALISLSGKK